MSKILSKPVASTIEHLAKIDKIAQENPDLTHECIKTILIAQQEALSNKLKSYSFSNAYALKKSNSQT